MAALPPQDVAIALEVPDATTTPAAVAKLLRVVASMPRLEAFVGQVCEVRRHMGLPIGGLCMQLPCGLTGICSKASACLQWLHQTVSAPDMRPDS